MNNFVTPEAVLARLAEQLRQESETFDQTKEQEARWFILKLVMGYSSVVLLAAIMIVASYILFNANSFPPSVATAAGAALFVDTLGLLIAVWKIVLNPNFFTRLAPVTAVPIADFQQLRDRT